MLTYERNRRLGVVFEDRLEGHLAAEAIAEEA